MTTEIDHAMRARDALADTARQWIRDLIERRKRRRKRNPEVDALYLKAARDCGRSHLHFKKLVQAEIARVCGQPITTNPKA